MNISKRKQGMLAIICTIAMIVTSITVYNPREVKADTDYSKLTYNYKHQGKAFMKGSENTESPWKVAIDESQSKGDIVNWMTAGAGNLNFYNDMFMNVTWHGNYPDATVEINSVKVEKKGNGVQVFNSAEIHVNAKEWINNNAYNVVKVTSKDGLQYVTFIVATGDKAVTSSEETTVAQNLSAPTQIYANINPDQTDYTVGVVQEVTGAEGYNFYINGKFAKTIAKDQVITIKEMEEKYGLKRGEVNKFGISAFNSKGESAITTIDVPVPGKKEETTTPTPETDEKTGNIVQGKIWKAYTYAEDSKGLYEISSDATNYTLKDKNIGSDWWHIQTAIDGVTFDANTDYVCTFTLKADKPKEFTVDNRIGDGKIFVESEGKGWQRAEDGTYFYKYKGTFASTTKQDLNVRIALGYHNGKDKKTDSNYAANDIATFEMSNFQIVKASEYKDVTYTVSIDGTKVGSAEPGDTYTLPTEAKYGYYDTVNKVIYKAGSEITVNDDVNLVSITNVSVKMYDGAAIRIAANEKTPGGIRFKASVDVTCGVAEYKNEITNKVQAGTLITTKDILDAKNDVEYNVENVNNIGKVLDVENTGWLDESTHSYSASLINIVKANYDRYFVAKAYVKVPYVKAAAEYVYSADDSGNSCANSVKRSISDVATAIKGNGEYDGITDDTIKKLIDSFIVTK